VLRNISQLNYRKLNIAKHVLAATSLAVVIGFVVVVVIIIPATQGGGWY